MANDSGVRKKKNRVHYLFGCASFPTIDPNEVSPPIRLIKEKYYAPEKFRVQPMPGMQLEGLREDVEIADGEGIFFKLPSLIKGYLRVGALLCGPPALDLEFGTSDLFLLLDVNRASDEYLKRFGLSASDVSRATR